MINFTIIIPHKNIPILLQRCLDSIPERDDIQIIVVDDNSDPDKVDFSTFPGLDRKNTEVYFTKEGKGAGYARNVGLLHAKGKWLLFADADDFFTPDLNIVLDIYKDSEYDVIYFKIKSVDSETLSPANRDEYINNLLEESQKTGNRDLLILVVAPWGRFVRRTLIENNNILFQESRYDNDVHFCARLATDTTNILISDFVFYCITYRQGSLTSVVTKEAAKIRFFVSLDRFYYLKKIGKADYLYSGIISRWRYVFGVNKILAISLIPQMFKIFNIRLSLRFIKQYIKRKKQNI